MRRELVAPWGEVVRRLLHLRDRGTHDVDEPRQGQEADVLADEVELFGIQRHDLDVVIAQVQFNRVPLAR